MTDVSFFGLGLMGSALARALLAGGRSVTVWNRTAAKAEPLVASGAVVAAGVGEAVEASAVLIVCVDNYRTTAALLASPEVAPGLAGKTVAQLSTGMPSEARAAQALYTSLGAAYLDGVILDYPEDVGRRHARLRYSGPRGVFDRLEETLKLMGGDSRYVGEAIGAAAAIDLALLTEELGVVAATAHGALICESEGVDLATYAELFGEHEAARWAIEVIRSDGFANPGATTQTWYEALKHIQQQAREAAINSEVPDFIAGLVGRGMAAGLGGEHIAAMVKVLRAGPPAS